MLSPGDSVSPSSEAGFVQVGVVAGAHGHDGRLRIRRETDNPGRFRVGAELWIGGRSFNVQWTGGAGDTFLVKAAGIETREEAIRLLHQPVLVPESTLPPLPEDTYYHYHLIDMRVQTESGEELGTVSEVIATGANDVYVVAAPDRELLLPAIADVVQGIDLEARRMTVRLPEGLDWRELKPAGRQIRKPGQRKRPARKPPRPPLPSS